MQSNKFGKIKIYGKSPFSISFDDVIKFDSVEEQESFFENSPLLTEIYSADDCSWIKKTGSIQVKGELPLFEKATYMWFENERGKRYYAFVLDTFYTNQDCTNIIFEIDAWQTFHIDLFTSSFSGYVEQAHEKNYLDPEKTKRNIVLIPQEVRVSKRYLTDITNIELVDWIVVVLKPGAKVNGSSNLGKPGIPGTFKSFRYFIIPCLLTLGRTLPYVFNGVYVESGDINTVVKFYTNTFSDDDSGIVNNNTVNQCVNIYTTKYCGLDYELKDGIVIIKSEYVDGEVNGFEYDFIDEDNSINSGTYDSTVEYTGGDLTYYGHTFSSNYIKRLIQWCRVFKVLPELCIVQLYNETNWGSAGTGPAPTNNWGGIKYYYSGSQITLKDIGITVYKGSVSPESDRYCRYSTVYDFIGHYCYLFRPKGYGNSGDGNFVVSGKTTFETALKGLFRIGGAMGDYGGVGNTSAERYANYSRTMNSIRNNMRTQFGSKLDEINSLVFG